MPVQPVISMDQIVIIVAFLMLLFLLMWFVKRNRGGIAGRLNPSRRMQHLEDLALAPHQKLHLIEVRGSLFTLARVMRRASSRWRERRRQARFLPNPRVARQPRRLNTPRRHRHRNRKAPLPLRWPRHGATTLRWGSANDRVGNQIHDCGRSGLSHGVSGHECAGTCPGNRHSGPQRQ